MSARIQRRLIGGALALAVLVFGGLGATVLLAPAPAVAVAVEQSAPTPEELERSTVKVLLDGGHGSGVVIGDGSLVLTAAHVADGAKDGKVRVQTSDGRIFLAEVEWIGAHDDVALLRLVGATLPPVALRCELPRIGEEVHVIGSPLFLEWVHTYGRVSDPDGSGDWAGRIVIDAPVYKGNSGGPVFDAQGRLIGILVAGLTVPAGWMPAPIGINFAVPAARVCELLGR